MSRMQSLGWSAKTDLHVGLVRAYTNFIDSILKLESL